MANLTPPYSTAGMDDTVSTHGRVGVPRVAGWAQAVQGHASIYGTRASIYEARIIDRASTMRPEYQ